MSNLLYFPDEGIDLLHVHLEHLANPNVRGVPIGVKEVDEYLLPLSDGDLGVILGRPGHMKSALMGHMARVASELAVNSDTDYAPPVYVSNEMPIEELALRNLSNYANIDSKEIRTGKNKNDWNLLHTSADDMGNDYPIVYIASSLYDRRTTNKITIEFVVESVEAVCEHYGKRPRLICIDYLQRMLTEQKIPERRLFISEIVDRLKDVALTYQVPMLIGSQAGREVDQEKFPVPTLRSGMESSTIEHTADWIVAGMRPSRYWKVGDTVPHSKNNLVITPDLFFLQVLKQRNGDAGKGFWLSFDPRITQLSDLELKYTQEDD